ncbi:hypothetical protein, partial [Flavisericum labens]|uniref:hypothetical protein n=1 Tax=Flavisericum labens TaxID=3377112 RepID=UPI00387B0753
MKTKKLITNLYKATFNISLFLCLGGLCSSNAQDYYPELESFSDPSPNASAFTLYGDYPVNYNTGLVDMRVPVYTIKSGSLTLPIDMSFHASGRRENEMNGFLGMRWVLNTGGIVTRTIQGYPDEWSGLTTYEVPGNDISQPIFSTNNYDNTHVPSFDELLYSSVIGFTYVYNNYGSSKKRQLDTYYDSEYDIFNYQLPSGRTGKFILKNENGVKKVMTMPYTPLKIELSKDDNDPESYTQITITDLDGTIYHFGEKNTEDYIEYETSENIRFPVSGWDHFVTGWYLKSITSADKQDVISFNYDGNILRQTATRIERVTKQDLVEHSGINVEDKNDYFQENPDPVDPFAVSLWGSVFDHDLGLTTCCLTETSEYQVPVLSSIVFKNGVLDFSYENVYGGKKLTEINLSGKTPYKFKFIQTIGENENYMRYLNGFQMLIPTTSGDKVFKEYNFSYYEPPSSTPLPNALFGGSILKDWWGYLNCNTTDLLPEQEIHLLPDIPSGCYNGGYGCDIIIGQSVNRDPDLESLKYGMLKSITYPTKGTTVFEYENNYYQDGSNIKKGPGLRIKKITNKPSQNQTDWVVKSFEYGENGNGAGYLNQAFWPGRYTVNEMKVYSMWDYTYDGVFFNNNAMQYRTREFNSESTLGSSAFGGNYVSYDVVNEYTGENNNTNLRTEYVYHPKYRSIDDPNGYNDNITEEFTGRWGTALTMDYPKVFIAPFNNISPQILLKGGKIAYKTQFKNVNGVYKKILKETFNYYCGSGYTLNNIAWDMPTFRHIYFYWDRDCCLNPGDRFDIEKDHPDPAIGYGLRKFVSGAANMYSKEIEYFDENGISYLTETKNFTFEPLHNLTKTQESTNSDGKVIRTEYEYPFEDVSVPINNK